MEDIMVKFMYYQNLIKLYHWQTKSYSRHKASDELYTTLLVKVDEFMEVMQGFEDRRLKLKKVTMIPIQNVSDNGAVKMLNSFLKYMEELDIDGSDLLNIRDEIVSAIKKTLYLFTFR